MTGDTVIAGFHKRENVGWRYVAGGRAPHALLTSDDSGHRRAFICGVTPVKTWQRDYRHTRVCWPHSRNAADALYGSTRAKIRPSGADGRQSGQCGAGTGMSGWVV